MEDITIPLGIPLDDDGYLDRECPKPECHYLFKVQSEDWEGTFRDETVFCPRCREEAPAADWWWSDHRDAIESIAISAFEEELDKSLKKMVSDFNRRSGGSEFVRMSVTGQRERSVQVPLEALRELQQKITCEKCGARFAVVGAAYFCPCCGHNSVLRTFNGSLTKVETKLSHLKEIRAALESASGVDAAEVTCQSLIESGLYDCVVAFQRYCECLYTSLPKTAEPRRNQFQSVSQGSELWKQATGNSYATILSALELELMNRLFQQRHLLAHTEGIVDQEYIDRSGDSTYRIGQRLVIQEREVHELVHVVRKLVEALRRAVQ